MKHPNQRIRLNRPNLRPVSLACATLGVLLAGASFTQTAFAGAGWADNVDKAGVPFKQATYFANSPQGLQVDYSPNAAPGSTRDTGTALRKFVDNLPMVDGYVTNPSLLAANPSLLGKHIPTAVKEVALAPAHSVSFPDADYYEIAVVEYREQLHADLPPVIKTGNVVTGGTTLRGYIQIWTPNLPSNTPKYQLFYLDGTPILDNKGKVVYGVGDRPHYLGPIIDSQSGVPVRLRFDNYLPTGRFDPLTKTRGGDVFIPTDVTVPGAGLGPNGAANMAAPLPTEMYSQNRAMIHLHGGDTPWISDGQPHSWITPAGETGTPYLRGETTQNVPDMPDFGAGTQTYYYPNNQSSRMEWYHDHSYAATRINVYAGIVSAFVIHDATEAAMKAPGGALAGMDEIPLIYETKTFVPKDINIEDAKWNVDASGNPKQRWGTYGDLWFPHVYEANQNPNSIDGTNPAGRWDYGPWFWPVFPAPMALPAGDVDNPSAVQEAYNDTPLINGVAYPNLNVEPKAYRFRLLNADGQRYVNLGLYVAEPLSLGLTNGGSGYTTPPAVTITAPSGGTGAATATALIDSTGAVVGFSNVNVSVPFSGAPQVAIAASPLGPNATATAVAAINTEVPMVPAVAPAGVTPYGVNTYDGRPGGIPDPAAIGPNIIQIGTEGGFLAQPNVIPSTPVSYQQLRRIVTVLNVLDHGLYVGPAERADLVIDFSQYAGKTLILYNDCPAPNPGFDARIDYYTGDVDQTSTGGAPTTLPGQGPNTRTIMRINVAATQAGGAAPAAPLDPANDGGPFAAALPAAFAASQDTPIVSESWQNTAYGKSFQDNLGRIYAGTTQEPNFSFSPPGAQTITGFTVDSQGTGYTTTPTVTLVGGLDPAYPNAVAATAHAIIDVAGQRLSSIVLDTAGGPYISAPSVVLNNGASGTNAGGIGAAASVITSTTQSWKVQNKGIQELFDQNYGRMNATFSVELPYTSVLTQTTIPVGYVDPPTEQISDGETQIWKITHNGVDTHVVHFHLFNVQVVNRVGWDGTVVALDPAEFGWKETVKMNPLEDIYVAVKPKTPKAPFGVPQSVRALDPTQPLGVSTGFSQVDPTTGLAATVVNEMHNFDWEYIWHCHILGHEENDFMRVISFNFGAVAPDAVAGVTFNPGSQVVSWIDPTPAGAVSTLGNKKNELGFLVQRSDDGGKTWNSNVVNGAWTSPNLPATMPQSAAQATQNPLGVLATVTAANTTSWVDPVAPRANTTYRVVAFNSAGYSVASATAGAPGGVNSISGSVGTWDAINNVFPVTLKWSSATPPKDGYVITRTGGLTATGNAVAPVTFNVAANLTTFVDTSADQISTYTYSIVGVSGTQQSAATQVVVNTTWAPPPDLPVSPTASTGPGSAVSINWTAPASTAYVTAYNIVRTGGTGPAVTFQTQQIMNALSGTIIPPATSYLDNTTVAGTLYTYTIVAVNGPLFAAPTATSTVQIQAGYAVPPAMGNVTATATSATSVTVSWPSQAVGSSTTGYQVIRTDLATLVQTKLNVPSGIATSFVDTTVQPNSSYTYQVNWVNGPLFGTSSVSATVTTPYAPAGTITSLTAVANTSAPAGVVLNWAVNGPDTVFSVARCLESTLNVNCTVGGTYTILSSAVPGNVMTYTDATPVSGNSYSYKVVANNGPVNVSAPVTTSVLFALPPASPTFATAPVISLGSIALSWTANAATPPAGFGTTNGYTVQRSADGGVTWTTLNASPIAGTSYNDTSAMTLGTTYQYRVFAVDTVGNVSLLSLQPSGVQSAAYTIPTAPVLAASVFGGNAATPTIKLSWTPGTAIASSPAVSGYQVFRDGVLLGSTAANVLTYTDTTVAAGHSGYVYQIVAINALSTLAAPNTATTTLSTVVQVAPVLSSASITSGTVSALTWTESAALGAPPVTGYQIYASVNGGVPTAIGPVQSASATSANVTTVVGNSYSFSVQALNLIGASSSSNTISESNVLQGVPSTPAMVASSASTATLSWSAGTATAGPAVLSYKVYNGSALLATVAASSTSYALSMTAGTTYNLSVSSVNAVGESAKSTAVSFVNTVPTAPVQAAAVVSGTTATVNWAETNSSSQPVTQYNLYNLTTANPSPSAANLLATAAAGTNSLSLTLTAGTPYNVVIQAVNAVGTSVSSNAVAFNTTGFPAPVTFTANPVVTAGVSAGTGTATLTWTANAATPPAGYAPTTGYIVQRSADGGVTWTSIANIAARTTVTYADSTLAANNTYQYRVLSTDTVNGVTIQAATASAVHTVAFVVPTAPTLGANTFAGTSAAPQVVLHWTAAAAIANAPAVTGFQVYRNGVLVATAAATATSYTDTAPGVGVTDTYLVNAVNLVGASTQVTAIASTAVQAAPSLATAAPSSGTVTAVSWSETANASAPPVTAYQIWASVNGATAVQMGANTAATATSANVNTVPGNTYVFSVKAVNLFGSSAASNSSSMVSNTVPVTVAQPTVTIVSGTSASVSWTASSVAAGAPAITGYQVLNGTTVLATVSPNVTSYTATMVAGTTYNFNVKAVNIVGSSVASANATVVNTVPTAPVAPALVTSSVVRNASATVGAGTAYDTASVTWPSVANIVNGQPVTSYIVQTASNTTFTTNLQTVTVPAGTGTQTASVQLYRGTATAPAGTDYVRVIAVNAVGQSVTSTANRLTVATTSLK